MNDWLQLALFIGLLALITKPIGIYLCKVLDPQGKTWLDPLLRPLEKITYRAMGIDPVQEHVRHAQHVRKLLLLHGAQPLLHPLRPMVLRP